MGVARYMVDDEEMQAIRQLELTEEALRNMSWCDKMKWRLHESKEERELDKQMRKINKGAFKRVIGPNDIERLNGPAFPVILEEDVYMTERGYKMWPQSGRIYNEDNSGFVMIGKGKMFAFVSVADGSVHFFGRKNSDLKRVDWALLKYKDILHFFGDKPAQVFDDMEVTPEPTGMAAEFLDTIHKTFDMKEKN